MKFSYLAAFSICTVIFGNVLHAEDRFCPTSLTPDCVTDAMLSSQADFETPAEKAKYTSVLISALLHIGQPEKAMTQIRENRQQFSRSQLSYFATAFIKAEQTEHAQDIFKLAAFVTAPNHETPQPPVRPLDLVRIANLQTDNGFTKDARQTLQNAAAVALALPSIEQMMHSGLLVATNQRLLGWPQDGAGTLEKMLELTNSAKSPFDREPDLGDIAKHFSLAGFTEQSQELFAIIRADIDKADLPPMVRETKIRDLIMDYIYAGLVNEAEQLAKSYQIKDYKTDAVRPVFELIMDETAISKVAHASTLARAYKVLAIISEPGAADLIYETTANLQAKNGAYQKSLKDILKIKNPTIYTKALNNLSQIIARNGKDPELAINMLQTHKISSKHRASPRAELDAIYTQTIIARSIIDHGEAARALPHLEQAFKMYLATLDTEQTKPWGLFFEFAKLGQKNQLYQKLNMISVAQHRAIMLQDMALGYAAGGHINEAVIAARKLKLAIPQLSDAPDEKLAPYWPKGKPTPTPQNMALKDLQRAYAGISTAFLKTNDTENALIYLKMAETGPTPAENITQLKIRLAKVFYKLGDEKSGLEIINALYNQARTENDPAKKAAQFWALVTFLGR